MVLSTEDISKDRRTFKIETRYAAGSGSYQHLIGEYNEMKATITAKYPTLICYLSTAYERDNAIMSLVVFPGSGKITAAIEKQLIAMAKDHLENLTEEEMTYDF